VTVLDRIRHHLTYANIAATLALFVALGGSAAAATHYLITSTHQIAPGVRNALKGSKGKAGPRGPKGATGQTGATGATGPKGDTGLTGTIDTSNFFTKTASDARYVQGSGSVTPIPLVSLANSASGGVISNVPGVGEIGAGICSGINSVFTYSNESAVVQDYILLGQYHDQQNSFNPGSGTVAAGASLITSNVLSHDILHLSVDLPRPTTWTITISRNSNGNCLYWGTVTSG
jgi:hypothetical protein